MNNIDSILLESVLDNCPLRDVIKNISQEIRNPIIVIDSNYKIIASFKSDKITDKYWINNLKKGYCSFEFISELKKILKNKEIPMDSTPYILNCPGSDVSRYVSKIISRNIHYGFVVILDNEMAFDKNTPLVLEKLSKTISSVYLNNFDVPENDDSKHQFIYSILMNDEMSEERINKDIEKYNLKIELPLTLMVIKSRLNETKIFTEQIRAFLPSSFINSIDNYIVVVEKTNEATKLLKQDNWNDFLFKNQLINIYDETVERLIGLNKQFRFMMSIFSDFSFILNENKSYDFSNLKSLLAINFKSKSNLMDLIPKAILSLREYDKKHNTEYISILDILLKSRFSKTIASKDLFIHRNSLTYHINKIEEITNLNLNDSSLDFELQLGLLILKML